MLSIPCFYHPTTLVLVDDDVDFLHSLQLALLPYYRCKIFSAPSSAQSFLHRQHKKYQQETHHYLTKSEEALNVSVNIAISEIYRQVFNPQRFSHACIAILDYDMPGVDGLTIARQLKATTKTKVIMLTGEADQATAVRAFNSQEIDRFVLKSTPDYISQLRQYITQLQQNYFAMYSIGISESLNSQGQHPLQDGDFVALFYDICAKHHIVEYYLVDESGSFLMLDATGKATWLVVRSDDDMQAFYEWAEGADDQHPLVELLKNRKKIVFFRHPDACWADTKEWIVRNTSVLNQQIYYALFAEKDGYPLDKSKIKTYQQFLNGDLTR